MPLDPYRNVRFLRIRTIAEQWYRDSIGVSLEVIESELRRAHINLAPGRDWEVDGLVPEDEMPALDDLPGSEIEVRKEFVKRFAQKQRWPLPRFWFPGEAPPTRRSGRPSHIPEILQELEARAERGELRKTMTEEARELNAWAVNRGRVSMDFRSVRRRISDRYKELNQ